jgi:hypothetical protein
LQEIIGPLDGIQVGGYIKVRGIDPFRLAKEKGLEGIIVNERAVPIRLAGAHRIR